MLVDTQLETTPVTVVTGPSINPIPPTIYTPVAASDGIHTYIGGPAMSGALWKLSRPLLANKGLLNYSFSLLLDAALIQQARALEFDCRVTDANGWTYPLDAQFNLATGWFQVATGVAANKIVWQNAVQMDLITGEPFINLTYSFDTVKHICSVLGVSMVGGLIPTPSALQNQPAVQIGWGKSEIVLQKQMCLNVAGAMSDRMRNITLTYPNT